MSRIFMYSNIKSQDTEPEIFIYTFNIQHLKRAKLTTTKPYTNLVHNPIKYSYSNYTNYDYQIQYKFYNFLIKEIYS